MNNIERAIVEYINYNPDKGTLSWRKVYKHWPSFVDHINGDKTDNRIINLRNVNHTINNFNKKSDAIHARRTAEIKYYGENCRG